MSKEDRDQGSIVTFGDKILLVDWYFLINLVKPNPTSYLSLQKGLSALINLGSINLLIKCYKKLRVLLYLIRKIHAANNPFQSMIKFTLNQWWDHLFFVKEEDKLIWKANKRGQKQRGIWWKQTLLTFQRGFIRDQHFLNF